MSHFMRMYGVHMFMGWYWFGETEKGNMKREEWMKQDGWESQFLGKFIVVIIIIIIIIIIVII